MEKVLFGHAPPPPLSCELFSPKPGRTYTLYVMDVWTGTWIHWAGKRSVPCLGSDCPKTRHRRPALWRGYLPAALWVPRPKDDIPAGWKPVVFSISPEQASELRPAVEVGKRLALEVCRERPTGPVDLSWKEVKQTPEDLPAVPDVQAVLLRVWGIRPMAAELTETAERGRDQYQEDRKEGK